MRPERGQSTVELALLLPVVAVVLLTVVQVGLIARDRVLAVHVARAAARAASVHPDPVTARRAVGEVDSGDGRFRVVLGGDLHPGGLATVTVTARPTTLPLLGRLMSRVQLRERLAVRVEGG